MLGSCLTFLDKKAALSGIGNIPECQINLTVFDLKVGCKAQNEQKKYRESGHLNFTDFQEKF